MRTRDKSIRFWRGSGLFHGSGSWIIFQDSTLPLADSAYSYILQYIPTDNLMKFTRNIGRMVGNNPCDFGEIGGGVRSTVFFLQVH